MRYSDWLQMGKKNPAGERRDFKDVPKLTGSYGQFEMGVYDKSVNFGRKREKHHGCCIRE